MHNTISLNDLYGNYKAGFLERKEFETAIIKTIREKLHCFRMPGWTREDCGDFISWFYLRISKAIDIYHENGSSFETYIGTMARLAAKEYRARQVRCYVAESAAWTTQAIDMYACENEVEYCEKISVEEEKPVKLRNPRQILILLLKCCNHVSIDFLE